MILYKQNQKSSVETKVPKRTMDLRIEEKPERPQYIFRSNKDRKKYIDMVKAYIRASMEYKSYIQFLKTHIDMDKCAVLKHLPTGNGKRYSIELHHDPFTLFEIINIVLARDESIGEPNNPYKLAEEVMELHYDDMVGLINLSTTMHELTEHGKIFIPLQYIYQRYDKFYDEFEDYMDDTMKAKIQLKVQMSLKCDKIISNCLDPEFVYMNVDGWDFPQVPEEWGKALKLNDPELLMDN